MNIQTAVIPVAGAGTRVFPMTTAIEKCMMPIYAGGQGLPVIHYMVADLARAGIKRIIFVTSERGRSQLKDYFEAINPNLETQLRGVDKDKLIQKELKRRGEFGMKFEYVIQPTDKYGTAYPPFLARECLKGESHFALMGGDDFVYREDSTSEMADAIKLWEQSGSDHVIMGNPIKREDGPKYGILHSNSDGQLTHFDEKPPIERVPEQPVANISRYLLSEAIWPQLEAEMARPRSGGDEHFIPYAINDALEAGQTFQIHRVSGKYLEGGSFEGLQAAGNYISAHPLADQPTV